MTRAEIETLVKNLATEHGLECLSGMEVFGSRDIGVRYRDPARRVGDMIPKVTFTVSQDDSEGDVLSKAAVAVACLKLNIQTGWNKAPAAPLDMAVVKE